MDWFWSVAGEVGITRANASVLHVSEEVPEGDKLTAKQLAVSLPRFRQDIQEYTDIAVICPLGPEAFRALMGRKTNQEDARGYLWCVADAQKTTTKVQQQIGVYKKDGKNGKQGDPKYKWVSVPTDAPLPKLFGGWIIPTYGPAYVMAMGRKPIWVWREDLRRVHRASANQLDIREPVVYDSIEVDALRGADYLVSDIETVGFSDIIDRIGVGNNGRAYTAAFNLATKDDFVEVLSDPSTTKVFHNSMFDVPKLRRSGVPVEGPVWDTMWGSQLVQPDQPKGLGRVSTWAHDRQPWKHFGADPAKAAYYNGVDVFTTDDIYLWQKKVLDLTGQTKLFTDNIMPVLPVLMDMTEGGIRVDIARLPRWKAELEAKLGLAIEKWYMIAPDVRPSSNPEVKKYLYQTLKLPIQRNKYDGVSVDELALRTLADYHPAHKDMLMTLLDVRKNAKLIGTYAKAEVDGAGYIHPRYGTATKDYDGDNKGAARTGRLAASDPNIQNQPQEARVIYIPDHDDWLFYEFDYQQAELRVIAALSGDSELAAALEGDIHEETRQRMGCNTRVEAKMTIYGSFYGAGPGTLQKQLQKKGVYVTLEECKELQRKLAKAYKKAWVWRETQGALGVAQQYLVNAFGRRCPFYGGNQARSACIDYEPQSDVGDILLDRLPAVWEIAKSMRSRLTTTVHDSMLVGGPAERADEIIGRVKASMERVFDNVAPGFYLPVDVKVGKSWGETKVVT